MDATRLGNSAVAADEPPTKRQKLEVQSTQRSEQYYWRRIAQYVEDELTKRVPDPPPVTPAKESQARANQAMRRRLKLGVLHNCHDLVAAKYDDQEFERALTEQVYNKIKMAVIYEHDRIMGNPIPTARPPARRPAISASPVPLPIIPNPGNIGGPARVARHPDPVAIANGNGTEGARSPLQSGPIPSTRPLSAAPSVAHSQTPRIPTQQVQRLGKPKKHVPTSPSNFRARAYWSIWHGKQQNEHQSPGYFMETERPYLSVTARQELSHSTLTFLHLDSAVLQNPVAVHFDFTQEEIAPLRAAVRQALGVEPKENRRDLEKDLGRQVARLRKRQIPLSKILEIAKIPRRSARDIESYLNDIMAMNKKAGKRPPPAFPSMVTVERDPYDQHASFTRASKIPSLLFTREITGHRGHHEAMRTHTNFANEFRKCRDDELELREEWTNCAGDISTIVWVSNENFICGTTEHSDSHNQQYNKPGNLVLGSCRVGTLRAYPDHRIVRPIVEKGENSTSAMRESQDPWLYSSVVSSDYDSNLGLAFTSSFDQTVKIWTTQDTDSGPSMKVQGTWVHEGNVNFVACSKHQSGMVATAADVAADAIRIYRIRNDNIGLSPFQSYACSRVTDDFGNTVSTEKWAFFPATMQWGLAPEVQHLLLVGYSPRSRTGDDMDIPLERRDKGELCLWDGLTGRRWKVTSATTQNVFEVLWHPSQASFIAATSPLGLDTDEGVRTQIRIFRPSDNLEYGGYAFSPVQTLDCAALDINELSIMPNSYTYCYITAACTDGKVYVWDTARGDKPIHVLRHGEPIDEYRGDREREDVGVKFTAWGTTSDRFYTGSSDGVVKVWNIRSHKRPLVRDLLEAPGPITCGMFSPDRSKLVVGDGTGRVFFLSLDAPDEAAKKSSFRTIMLPNGKTKVVRPPKSTIHHKEPPPPEFNADGSLAEREDSQTVLRRAKEYLDNQQLTLHPYNSRWVMQGPRYAELGFYRRECHWDEDPAQPLMARWSALQADHNKGSGAKGRRLQFRPLKPIVWEANDSSTSTTTSTVIERHKMNIEKDLSLDIDKLPEETKKQLHDDGVDLEEVERPDYMFDYDDDDDDDEW